MINVQLEYKDGQKIHNTIRKNTPKKQSHLH